jgi:hypothetical protein
MKPGWIVEKIIAIAGIKKVNAFMPSKVGDAPVT